MNELIGRTRELSQIEQCYNSSRSEFVVVYGRRRIGKTFLVNQALAGRMSFCYVGGHKLSESEQLQSFGNALKEYSGSPFAPHFSSWQDAFETLKDYLKSLPSQQRIVIFIDEMPWIDTPGSNFVKALENFWNGWAALHNNIFLIASGSATSWMVEKLFANQGGLYNRITQQIYLRPFTLTEFEEYLHCKGCTWDRYQILQAYMVLGGVPYYLSLLNVNDSLAQNVDNLFFSKNGQLRNEFDNLYQVLFGSADKYVAVIRALAEKRSGLTRAEISEKVNVQGGFLTKLLDNLEKCDFIISFAHYNRKVKNAVYKLSDLYTLFYLKFVENNRSKDSQYWTHNLNGPSLASWQGFTFELVCLLHLDQIKKKLGITGMATEACTWRDDNSQIDLIIERADRIVNICEIKFATLPYTIDKAYHDKLLLRAATFRDAAKVRKGMLHTFVTTYGLTPNTYSHIANSQVTMDDLFA